MTPKKKIYFHKINGKSKGKRLEVLVNSEIVERLLIQPNMGIGEFPTYVRIIGSNSFDKNIAYRLDDPENYRDIIKRIEKTAKAKYGHPKEIRRFLLRKPKIEIKVHNHIQQ
jgi:hypothetical protein